MPRSPLTLLLMVLTLLAFAVQALSLVTDWWRTFPFAAPGVLLVIATTASIVRDGGAFDSRAFHRTRPRGEAKAFRNSTLRLAGLALGAALMGLASFLVMNLGWAAALRSAVGCGLPVWFLAAACAAGFTLVLSKESRPMVTILLLLLPVAMEAVLLTEMDPIPLPFYLGYTSVLRQFFVMPGVAVIGGVGYSLAWWLVTRSRRRTAALVTAFLTGGCLPLGFYLGRLPVGEPPVLPELQLEVTRSVPAVPNPVEERARKLLRDEYAKEAARHREDDEGERGAHYVPIFLAGRLHVKGLGEDEFVWPQFLVPGPSRNESEPAVSVGQGEIMNDGGWVMARPATDAFILPGDPSAEMSGEQSLMKHLIGRLPQPSHEEDDGRDADTKERELDWINVDEKRTSIAEVEAREWRVDGVVYRLEEAGNYDVARGGWFRMPSGGSVVVAPLPQKSENETVPPGIRCRMVITPRCKEELEAGRLQGGFPTIPAALLRDPLTGDTRVLQIVPDYQWGNAVWRYYRIRLADNGQDEKDPELRAKALRSRLYLFRPVPVGRVNVAVPPSK